MLDRTRNRRVRRVRIPWFQRRDLPGVYLAMLAFGLVAFLLPEPGPAVVVAPPVPVVAPPPPPVQVQVVPAGPVVVRDKVLNRLADAHLVALTFDDGPDPKWTPQILAVLHRYGAVATFCEIGRNVQANPSLVSQIVEAGNQLCDHTMTHDERLPDKPPDTITSEIVGAQNTMSAASGGAPVQWYRAPGGNWAEDVTSIATHHGMQPLGWNVDTEDWKRPGVAAIVAAVQQQSRQQAPDGIIVLMHDGGGPRDETVTALDQLIPWLVARGYRFGFPVPPPLLAGPSAPPWWSSPADDATATTDPTSSASAQRTTAPMPMPTGGPRE